MFNTLSDWDLIVAGGGMVGASLALALARQGVRVAVIEGRPPERTWPAGEVSARVSALSRASQRILDRLGAWEPMTALGVSPYRAMEVWEAGGSGRIRFDSADLGEPDLGHIVENRGIQRALWERLEALESAGLYCPARLADFQVTERSVRVTLEDGAHLEAALLVGADGRDSAVRLLAGIETQGWDYDQQALVANVTHELWHEETAWQRFRPSGPLAFLPLSHGHASSIVWSTHPDQAQELARLEPPEFCAALGDAFGHRLGRVLGTGPRACFPLCLRHAREYARPRLALVGDAAHAVHPLAGQGVNLGFLDAACLAEVLLTAWRQGRDIGELGVTRRYERTRKGHNLAMLGAMDLFKRLFGADLAPLRWLRNGGLNLVDACPPVKQHFMAEALGLIGELPELARP